MPLREASEFVVRHHYAHGHMRAAKPCIGMFDDERLVGVCMFSTPASENVRRAVFGREHVQRVIELHRLVLLDEMPKNSESAFIAASLRFLLVSHPEKRAVVSFADPSAGHVGTIYQATNFTYTGQSGKATFYLDGNRLRHPRQCGVNISPATARQRGWVPVRRDGKYRYIIIVGPNRKERAHWSKMMLWPALPYPKSNHHGVVSDTSDTHGNQP